MLYSRIFIQLKKQTPIRVVKVLLQYSAKSYLKT